jgi:uncharacterized membrane protein
MRRTPDLSVPRSQLRFGVHYDPEAFGRFSESIARFLGTARFLVAQSAIVVVWIIINLVAAGLRWDPYPFILLNLAFSTQAAYAAPLILLAQNRQGQREREVTERDRQLTARTQADAEFLARELASIRLALADVVTSADIDDLVDRVAESVARRLEAVESFERKKDSEPLANWAGEAPGQT